MKTPKQPKHVWVLRQVGDADDGRYWCGLGNPKFLDPKEGTRYFTKKEARAQAKYLLNELDMGRFIPEKLIGVVVALQQLLARQRWNARRNDVLSQAGVPS
jgi:hypothetical protein